MIKVRKPHSQVYVGPDWSVCGAVIEAIIDHKGVKYRVEWWDGKARFEAMFHDSECKNLSDHMDSDDMMLALSDSPS